MMQGITMDASTDLTWAEAHIEIQQGFPRVDWKALRAPVRERFAKSEWHDVYNGLCRLWLFKTVAALSPGYRLHESEHFILLTAATDRYVGLLLKSLEKYRRAILADLNGIASANGFGKHVALLFEDESSYYEYIGFFYPDEGEYAFSAGVQIATGYRHFALPRKDLTYVEPVVAHELTHNCLSHLRIPKWLNEGLAVTMESRLTGAKPFKLDGGMLAAHRRFWNEIEIQDFWSGRSFSRPEEATRLSYHLARWCVRALSHDYEQFRDFANQARYEDGGEKAAETIFGGGLGGLIEQFLGPGNWSPRPESWNSDGEG